MLLEGASVVLNYTNCVCLGGASSGFNEELENDAFRELEAGLNDVMYHQKEAPPQLTALRCSGIGSPKKVC